MKLSVDLYVTYVPWLVPGDHRNAIQIRSKIKFNVEKKLNIWCITFNLFGYSMIII